MVEIIIGLVGLIVGGGVAFVVLNGKNKGKASAIISEAKKRCRSIKEGEVASSKREIY